MKNIKLYSLLTLSLLILGSCSDFLKEEPTGSLTTESTLSSRDAGIAFATGAYRALRGWTDGTTDWGGNQFNCLEYMTGKAYSQYMGARLFEYEEGSESGEQSTAKGRWSNWYTGVRDCNLAIERIPTISGMSESDKQYYLAEVRTLRALYYFCLTRFYGDVVYNIANAPTIAETYQPRSSLKKIYDEIIVPDLEFAVNSNLPDKTTDGRVSKNAARVILADVYLTMAGYPYQEVATNPEKAWCTEASWSMTEYPVAAGLPYLQKSKALLDQLYGQYPLGDFSDLRTPAMKNKGGSIFDINYMASVSEFPVNMFVPMTLYSSVFSTECGTGVPSTAYYNSYDPADIRIQDRVYFYYSDTKAPKYDPNESPCAKFPVAFLFKYYDEKAVKETAHPDINFSLYRYADVLLLLTEVNWTIRALGGSVSDDDLVKGINEIRRRAGLSEYTATLTLKDILSERAYELVFENRMLWDMRRTRKALVDGDGEFKALENFVGHQPTSFNHRFEPKHLLTPISADEIRNNYAVEQNGGWLPQQTGTGH
ncbi:MAG: RagB/SusD family nutrient uptake outer membrane protein [Tannerella sp.]|jgi:hypothetical protein|nr:RagB/SusD family nutrient uptake outer membrane protein [Tannerella sp.]